MAVLLGSLSAPGIHPLARRSSDRKGFSASRLSIRCCESSPPRDYVPVVKMCGITTPGDASRAAAAGASYIGMILWPRSKRSVSISLAREIAAAAREQGAVPVGVFVDEDAHTIADSCREAGLDCAQLHGTGARAALDGLASSSSSLRVIYVAHAGKDGSIQTPQPVAGAPVEWTLIDSIQGGSGESFDWESLSRPGLGFVGKRGWFLAGGLKPENVGRAISLLRPSGVDVSSGIAGPDGIAKDLDRIASFVSAVHNWRSQQEENALLL
ncbi:N-(5'-phosphoribosyl)anthranilate isomerase 1, chloroplastic [Selaginella moellendorffii]|nr:N-(5'-phosphoribosyl)anthranilate isomerase 1, chloroplastic [Selaginella moellendorffii]|eukprot:XP_002962023.2 N-(5'-phosphoribosyl)anthranilate isomerase 1, chloroplastic [Selaginella moellendorffii]